ncbi:MAG: hypothetical protein ACI9YT_002361 [Halobacteriales archaeon]|jgi:hypothetical protein
MQSPFFANGKCFPWGGQVGLSSVSERSVMNPCSEFITTDGSAAGKDVSRMGRNACESLRERGRYTGGLQRAEVDLPG